MKRDIYGDLLLSNGIRLSGRAFGSFSERSGELVFSTGMVGYGEAITDPSYFGQILVFTYPSIGNYGIPRTSEDGPIPSLESATPKVSGVIITSASPSASHWNSDQTLHAWLKNAGVPGLMDIDTRYLVQQIRSHPGLLARIEFDGTRHREDFFDPSQHNLLPHVSTKDPLKLGSGRIRLAIIDCGVKWSIVKNLRHDNFEVLILPWDTDPDEVDCDGWIVSNGPGDPTSCTSILPNVKKLLDHGRPTLGICLGHQLMALAAGARTHRMLYGHRSHNQPVHLVDGFRCFMTTQNHGYVVDDVTLPEEWRPWFRNVNDQSIEGLFHTSKPFKSVQFHPEASAGPWDTQWILREFQNDLIRYHAKRAA